MKEILRKIKEWFLNMFSFHEDYYKKVIDKKKDKK